MAGDKRLKLKDVTYGEVFTHQAAKRINTGLTHYVCFNNQHRVKQLHLYTLEIKTGYHLASKSIFRVSNKISIKRCCVNVFKVTNKKKANSSIIDLAVLLSTLN